jgi:tryptophan-rich sensory protein
MAISAWLVWRSSGWRGARFAMVLFFVQLGLNVTWSGLFFGLSAPGAALVEILFLLAAIVVTAIAFRSFSGTSFWLMTPYAAWVMFASFLGFKIWRLNSGSR